MNSNELLMTSPPTTCRGISEAASSPSRRPSILPRGRHLAAGDSICEAGGAARPRNQRAAGVCLVRICSVIAAWGGLEGPWPVGTDDNIEPPCMLHTQRSYYRVFLLA